MHFEGAYPNTSAIYNLNIEYTENCWLKNVEGQYGETGIVFLTYSKNFELRHSSFLANRVLGVGVYSVLIGVSSQVLVEDNIFAGGVGTKAQVQW